MISKLARCLSHPAVEYGLLLFSVLAVVASVILVPRFLARLPVDYLRADSASPAPALLVRILRNLAGIVLVLLGVAMLVLPGQGLLTLLVGVLLLDFPGKHRLVQRMLGRPKVLDVVNKLRARHAQPPLHAPG